MKEVTNNRSALKPLLGRGLGRLPAWIKNKYLLAGAAFLVWIVFFDEKDIPSTISKLKVDGKLQKTKIHLNKQIANTQKDLYLLKTNPLTIEKYARENYLMKKDNEDLFIISNPAENK
jgi:cell division protein DivIC